MSDNGYRIADETIDAPYDLLRVAFRKKYNIDELEEQWIDAGLSLQEILDEEDRLYREFLATYEDSLFYQLIESGNGAEMASEPENGYQSMDEIIAEIDALVATINEELVEKSSESETASEPENGCKTTDVRIDAVNALAAAFNKRYNLTELEDQWIDAGLSLQEMQDEEDRLYREFLASYESSPFSKKGKDVINRNSVH